MKRRARRAEDRQGGGKRAIIFVWDEKRKNKNGTFIQLFEQRKTKSMFSSKDKKRRGTKKESDLNIVGSYYFRRCSEIIRNNKSSWQRIFFFPNFILEPVHLFLSLASRRHSSAPVVGRIKRRPAEIMTSQSHKKIRSLVLGSKCVLAAFISRANE